MLLYFINPSLTEIAEFFGAFARQLPKGLSLSIAKPPKSALLGGLAIDKDSPLGNWRAKAPKNSAISVKEGLIKYNNNTLKFQRGPKLFKNPTFIDGHLNVNDTDTSGIYSALYIPEVSVSFTFR